MQQGKKFSMIVLAGGESRRMGTDKAKLTINGHTFLETQIQKGRELGIKDILVSGYRGECTGARVIKDRVAAKGPLGGLEACLREAKYPRCLVLSVDVPLVPVEELRNLLKTSEHCSELVTILKHGEKEQPLIAVYDCSLAEEMMREILEKKGSVFAFINRVGYGVYETKAENRLFSNINDQKGYKQIFEC